MIPSGDRTRAAIGERVPRDGETVATFSGWFDCRMQGARGPARAIRREDQSDTILLEGEGLRIVADPSRIDYAIGESTLTLCAGAPRFDGKALAKPAAAIAAALRAGRSVAPPLRGRFALLHFDLVARSVRLMTDRFGVHPICYSHRDARVSFADRADAVPVQGPRQIDLQAVYNYVYFHVIPAPRTIFRDVIRLESCQSVSIDGRGVRSEFWWRPRFDGRESAPLDALKSRFRELVRNAVEREATTSRIGTFLSGGTDSSTVAGFLSQIAGRRIPTFSIGFDANGYDEIGYARIASKHFDTDQREYYVTPEDLVRGIADVAAFYDQPFGNSSALPAYFCSLKAREAGVEKMLAGDGGDELFGGNVRYAKQKVFDAYHALPAALRSRFLEPLLIRSAWPRRTPLLKKAVSYIEQARVPMPDRMETYNLLEHFGARAVFTEGFLARIEPDEPGALQRAVYARAATPSLVDRMLAYDWRFTLVDNDLPKVACTAQLAGQAVGFPLLDDDLVDFSLELAPSMKVRGLTLRYFFKEALRGFLPDEIINKRKHGFGLPFGPWLAQSEPLRLLARGAVDRLAERRIVRHELVDELFTARLTDHAGYFGEMIWILMMLERWLDAKAPDFAIEQP